MLRIDIRSKKTGIIEVDHGIKKLFDYSDTSRRENTGISIIIPVRNRVVCLQHTLAALLGQSASTFEIIIVEDDEYPKLVSTIPDSPNVRYKYLHNRNRFNIAKAVAAGVQMASYPLLCAHSVDLIPQRDYIADVSDKLLHFDYVILIDKIYKINAMEGEQWIWDGDTVDEYQIGSIGVRKRYYQSSGGMSPLLTDPAMSWKEFQVRSSDAKYYIAKAAQFIHIGHETLPIDVEEHQRNSIIYDWLLRGRPQVGGI